MKTPGTIFTKAIIATGIFVVIIVAASTRSDAWFKDKNHHTICGADTGTSVGEQPCMQFSDFVQRRDRCVGPNADPCFGVVKTSDGFHSGLITNGRCGRPEGDCTPMPFRFATLEYRTDLGDEAKRWQPQQLKAIESDIRNDPKVFLVVFVHGWRHSAKENPGHEHPPYVDDPDGIDQDRNLRYFKHFLAKAKWELVRAGRTDLRVLGVYVGWNGGPEATVPAVAALGSRARAADRLGNSSDFASDMESLSRTLFGANGSNRMLLVGHSFGGRIVSRYMLKAIETKRQWAPLGEKALAITINPAISADSFVSVMAEAHQSRLPTWINFTSTDDDATRNLFGIASFPLARFVGVGAGLNDTLHSKATGSTIGHYRPFQTHRLQVCFEDSSNKNSNQCRESSLQAQLNCDSVDIPKKRGPSGWYKTSSDSSRTCRYFCASYDDNSLKCSNERYLSVLDTLDEVGPLAAPPGRMWNVITNKDVIGPDGPFTDASAINHNAFVQSNLTRMVIEMVLER